MSTGSDRWAIKDHKREIFEVLAVLPSESTIHFAVFISLVILVLLVVVVTPAIALFFAESRPIAGTLFFTINIAIFIWTCHAAFRKKLHVPQRSVFARALQPLLGKLRRFAGTKRIAGKISARLGANFFPYPEQTGHSSFLPFFKDCWNRVAPESKVPPRLYWNYQDRRASARVAGRSQEPVVAVTAGLVGLLPQKPEIVRVYLLHEFGHIINQDLEIFALTIASSNAARIAMFSSALFAGLFLLRFVDDTIMTGLLALASVMWALSLLVLWLFLARYAGVIISLRELYADVQAVLWLPAFEAYKSALEVHRPPWLRRVWHRFRSLISMRLIHLSPDERLTLLERPKSLLLPRHKYYVLVGLLLIALQSNPFGEGVDNNWMRWPFLLAWAPLCFAYLLNLARAILGVAFFPERRFWPVAGLALSLSAVLLLPMFKISGLYGELVLGLGAPSGFWLGIMDILKTISVQWGHISFVVLPASAFFWLCLSSTNARQALHELNPQVAKPLVARAYRVMLFISLTAVLAETVLVGIEQFGSSQVTFLDRWQDFLGGNKLIPPCAALGILFIGSFIIWLLVFRKRLRMQHV